jgi:hypothetical protein
MDNEPTLEIDGRGNKLWWLDGELHREDGPAVEFISGTKSWRLHGKWHRVDGPAYEYPDGSKYWWLNDIGYEFDEWLEVNTLISEEEKLMLKLQYG